MVQNDNPRVAPPSRRDLLQRGTLGFGALALADLLRRDGLLASEPRPQVRRSPSRVRSVVFFFVGGGPSHVDTFDPKPLLQRLDGQDVPESLARDIPTIARSPLNNLLASPWKFRPAGRSGLPVSELFPHLATCVDDLCILRSCRHATPIHAPAEFLTFTGTPVGDRPSLGAWLTYGLGSDNQDLPGFVVFKTGETVRPAAMGPGFLPASYQGTFVDPQKGIAHTSLPPGLSNGDRRRQLDLIGSLNRLHQERHPGQSELEARIRAYELSFRMQARAPEVFSLAGETKETLSLYGCEQADTAEYGRILLLTRRLVERGVRFIQIRSGGWDAHSDLLGNHGKKCRQTDQPLAGFLKDLKRRGLLEETLVIWGGEFGRTPASQRGAAKPGRDHSPLGYTMWLAGGGVRGGQAIGATDPVGYAAIDRPIHPNDLHATLLHALGIDQHDLYFERHGRKEIVTVVTGNLVREVFG
jgi:hypothetical protein